MDEGFLLGVIATSSMVAALYFLKFWKATRDGFFLAFAISFLLEGLNRTSMLLMDHPGEGSTWRYIVRLVSLLLILGAILRKNSQKD